MTFAEYAKDHRVHPHCAGCGNCLLDPAMSVVSAIYPMWCVGCARDLKQKLPPGARMPWLVEFADLSDPDQGAGGGR